MPSSSDLLTPHQVHASVTFTSTNVSGGNWPLIVCSSQNWLNSHAFTPSLPRIQRSDCRYRGNYVFGMSKFVIADLSVPDGPVASARSSARQHASSGVSNYGHNSEEAQQKDA